MFPPSPLNRLAPQGYQMPDNNSDIMRPTENPLAALSGAGAATGGDPSPLLSLLKQHIMSMPNAADYAPNPSRRIFAAIAGMGAGAHPSGISMGNPIGFQNDAGQQQAVTQAIDRQPYNTAMAGFDDKAKMLEAGANVEERANVAKEGAKARAEANRIREKELDEQNRIRQEESERKAAADDARNQQKISDAEAKAKKAQDDLDEKKREADMRQGNADALMKLKDATLAAVTAQHAVDNARRDAQLEETKREHDLLKQRSDDAIAAANARADAALAEKKRNDNLVDAAKNREKDTTTVNPPNFFQRNFPSIFSPPEGKTTKTTYTPMPGKATANPSGGNIPEKAPPTGAKPGGKWITLPSGRQVYQEP